MVSFKGYRPIKSSRPDANVTLLHVGSSLVIQRDSSQIAVIKDNQQIPILRAWLNFRTDLDY